MPFMRCSSIRYLLFPNRCLQVLLIHIPMQHPSVSIWRMGTLCFILNHRVSKGASQFLGTVRPPPIFFRFLFLGRIYEFYSIARLGENVIRWLFARPGVNISPVLSLLMSRCDEVFVSLWVGPVNGGEADFILLPRNHLNHVSRLR